MWRRIRGFAGRLCAEPPIRMLARPLVRVLPFSQRTKAAWDATERPHYLVGVLRAADEARAEGVTAMSVVELGVAGGRGLIALQQYASDVERETGIDIRVFGFDSGRGLPPLCGDYRDHPDHWRAQDYPIDEPALRRRLGPKTTLIIGDVAATVPAFVHDAGAPPVGFVAVDLDLYSSTKAALQMLLLPQRRMLRRVVLYFDDVQAFFNHAFAGELLAIREFNAASHDVKIDRWRGLAAGRVFHESPWLASMYVAHDLGAINATTVTRPPEELALSD